MRLTGLAVALLVGILGAGCENPETAATSAAENQEQAENPWPEEPFAGAGESESDVEIGFATNPFAPEDSSAGNEGGNPFPGEPDTTGGEEGGESPLCSLDCSGKECGDDGCGGLCGLCDVGMMCAEGVCVPNTCEAQCAGKECGDDGCGGLCGTCPQGLFCSFGKGSDTHSTPN